MGAGTGSLRFAAYALTGAAVILWGAIIAGMWVTIPEGVTDFLSAAAETDTIIAAILWVTRTNRRRQEGHGLLVRALTEITRPVARRATIPMRRVK